MSTPETTSTPRTYRQWDRQQPLSPDRLDEGVRGVDPDEHQHEEEQHHHRAGVDDHLDDGEERGVEGDVEHGQAQHHRGEEQRTVNGLPHEDQPERGDHRDGAGDPEGDHDPLSWPATDAAPPPLSDVLALTRPAPR